MAGMRRRDVPRGGPGARADLDECEVVDEVDLEDSHREDLRPETGGEQVVQFVGVRDGPVELDLDPRVAPRQARTVDEGEGAHEEGHQRQQQ